jgi:hypothetical protein
MFNLKSILEVPLRGRQRDLAHGRSPMPKEHFIDAIASTELGKTAANLLWGKLSELVVYDGFTPHPDDDLLKVYGLAEEDLDEDVILEIIKASGSHIPDSEALARFGPVNTPSAIIRLIETSN